MKTTYSLGFLALAALILGTGCNTKTEQQVDTTINTYTNAPQEAEDATNAFNDKSAQQQQMINDIQNQ